MAPVIAFVLTHAGPLADLSPEASKFGKPGI